MIKMGDRDDWRIDFARYGGPYIVECGLTNANPDVGNTIAKVFDSYDVNGRSRDFPTLQKRCYVLAAAPMLLDALATLVDNVETGSYESTGLALDYAKSVIAKAVPITSGDRE